MRRAVLLKSVRRQLHDDERLIDAAFMWSRHRLMVPYTALAFVGLLLVASVGFETWASRVGLAFAGAAVAAMASTDYHVLARTNEGFVLLRASRVRQYAVGVAERWPATIELQRVAGQIVISDWLVADRRFTVPRTSEQSMVSMAAGR